MDISLVADTVTVASTKGLGFAKLLLQRADCNAEQSLSSSSSSSYPRYLQIYAMISPVDAVAPPPVKSNSYRIRGRNLLKRKRRTRRKLAGGDSGDGEDEGFSFGDGDGDGDGGDGSFGGGGSGGSWNYGRFGGHNWDESSPSSSDPAFDFVYEVLSWIVLSNCLHFAFKKILRNVADWVADSEREKVPMRLTRIC
ncbi:ATP-dependent RNA helicase A-like [Quillaja saponaria]|uniref:ATP-dependent RNA helicase A-like n=1 Tax=Quillaja saponaria TaxID=32244 RepID=A0AAD7QF60_QUISA|nr:ATP-dependent RNA helicase A-like [Quillaja saponaria]